MSKKENLSNYCDNEICTNEERLGRGSKHVHVVKSLIMRCFLNNSKPMFWVIWKTIYVWIKPRKITDCLC